MTGDFAQAIDNVADRCCPGKRWQLREQSLAVDVGVAIGQARHDRMTFQVKPGYLGTRLLRPVAWCAYCSDPLALDPHCGGSRRLIVARDDGAVVEQA